MSKQESGNTLLIVLLVAGALLVGFFFVRQVNTEIKQRKAVYQHQINAAKDKKIKVDLETLELTINLYKKDNGTYPKDLQTLTQDDKLYITYIPKNPYTNSDYNYQTDGQKYTLSTKLGDGTEYKVSK